MHSASAKRSNPASIYKGKGKGSTGRVMQKRLASARKNAQDIAPRAADNFRACTLEIKIVDEPPHKNEIHIETTKPSKESGRVEVIPNTDLGESVVRMPAKGQKGTISKRQPNPMQTATPISPRQTPSRATSMEKSDKGIVKAVSNQGAPKLADTQEPGQGNSGSGTAVGG